MEKIYFWIGAIVFWATVLLATYLTSIAAWRVLHKKVDIFTVWVLIVGSHKKWGEAEIKRTKEHLYIWGEDKSLLGLWKRFLIRQLLKPHQKPTL